MIAKWQAPWKFNHSKSTHFSLLSSNQTREMASLPSFSFPFSHLSSNPNIAQGCRFGSRPTSQLTMFTQATNGDSFNFDGFNLWLGLVILCLLRFNWIRVCLGEIRLFEGWALSGEYTLLRWVSTISWIFVKICLCIYLEIYKSEKLVENL